MLLAQARATVPAEAELPCPAPVLLPDRAISAAETTSLWGADRGALRTCESRRAAAVDATGGQP